MNDHGSEITNGLYISIKFGSFSLINSALHADKEHIANTSKPSGGKCVELAMIIIVYFDV